MEYFWSFQNSQKSSDSWLKVVKSLETAILHEKFLRMFFALQVSSEGDSVAEITELFRKNEYDAEKLTRARLLVCEEISSLVPEFLTFHSVLEFLTHLAASAKREEKGMEISSFLMLQRTNLLWK